MRKNSRVILVLSVCFAFGSLMSSCQYFKNKKAMDQITKEVFEPQLAEFAKEQFLEDCIVHPIQKEEKFVVNKIERRGSIVIEDLPNNEGKTGSCSFYVSIEKHKNNGTIKDKGNVIIWVSGIVELNNSGDPQFIRDKYEYVENHCETLGTIKIGIKRAATTAKKVIPLAKEYAEIIRNNQKNNNKK